MARKTKGTSSFDWRKFFESNSIEYVTTGPNVSQGNINIKCPFCGSGDPSHHMGVSIHGRGWSCWRAADHRGIAPQRLIMALLGCDKARADGIAGRKPSLSPSGPIQALREAMENTPTAYIATSGGTAKQKKKDPGKLKVSMVSAQRPINVSKGSRFWSYMQGRGFLYNGETMKVLNSNHVFFCKKGLFKDRVLFAIRHKGEVVTWTARAIGQSSVRYKSLSEKPSNIQGMPLAKRNIKDCLYGYDDLINLTGRDSFFNILLVCEGPMDALKLDYLKGKLSRAGEHARRRPGTPPVNFQHTCLFGVTVSEKQVMLLEKLSKVFDKIVFLLDPETVVNQVDALSNFAGVDVSLGEIPEGYEDPGALDSVGYRAMIINMEDKFSKEKKLHTINFSANMQWPRQPLPSFNKVITTGVV